MDEFSLLAGVSFKVLAQGFAAGQRDEAASMGFGSGRFVKNTETWRGDGALLTTIQVDAVYEN